MYRQIYRRILCIILTVICIGVPLTLSASETESEQGNYEKEEPYICPVTPGSDEWAALSLEEKLEVSRISEEEIGVLTTDALLASIFYYPFLTDIFTISMLNDSVMMLNAKYNG